MERFIIHLTLDFLEQLEYIINHAENKFIVSDTSFVQILENLEEKIPNVKGIIFLTDKDNMPETSLKNVFCYEDMINAEDDNFSWVKIDERDACGLCYTSGTTGNPKEYYILINQMYYIH
ncbi:MAG: hypothetical protein CM15mP109_15820 [Candidatus Dadabacteria bacterium]|nr:MAG: hypothetical protein CM15mP109_15820 [Candidatus Dadabacteria bacterium]